MRLLLNFLLVPGVVLAGWVVLSGAVFAAAACAGVRDVWFRRCLIVSLAAVPALAIMLAFLGYGGMDALTAGPIAPVAAPTAYLALFLVETILARYLLRTTWLRALATFLVASLYALTLGAIVYRIAFGTL